MQEIWKDILGYEKLYQISNFGNVKSLDKKDSLGRRVKGKQMMPIFRKDGYLDITLHKDGKCKHFLIHRLVAQMFIKNSNNYKEINHKDEDKTNNNINNLEWCSRSYNINYGVANKKRRKTLLNKRGKTVFKYDKDNNLLQSYPSLQQATRETKINQSHISQCCNNKRKTAGGFVWRYAENILCKGDVK